MKPKKSKFLKLLLSLGVTLAILVWMYRSIAWSEVGQVLTQTNYLAFLPVTICFIAHYLLRAWRWRLLLPEPTSNSDCSLRLRFDSIMLGAFANYTLPLRAGELARPYMLSKMCSHPFSSSLVSVVVERFFDLTAVLLSFGLMMIYLKQETSSIPEWVFVGSMSLTTLSGLIVIFMTLSSFAPSAAESLIELLSKPLPEKIKIPLLKFSNDLVKGAGILRNGWNLLLVLLLTAAVWISSYLLFYLFMLLFDMPTGIWMAISVNVLTALAVAAPSAPGFIGVYQLGCIAGFALFNVNKEVAVAYSVVSHAYQFIFFVTYGVFVLLKYNLNFSDMSGKSEA